MLSRSIVAQQIISGVDSEYRYFRSLLLEISLSFSSSHLQAALLLQLAEAYAIAILTQSDRPRKAGFMSTRSTPIGYILIGLPGSGKSTLAHQLVTLHSYYQLVSTDQIREHLYGKSSIQGDWATIEHHVLSQIQQAIQSQKTVIYDATNYNRRYRIDLLKKLFKLSSIQWVGLYLKTPIEQCKVRNQQRDRRVSEGVIEMMDECLRASPPNIHEGFSKIYEIGVDMEAFLKELG